MHIVARLQALAAVGAALIAGGMAGQAAANGLADGEYDCGGGYTYRAMGKVDIEGDRFRYRPFETVVNGFASYSVEADGTIRWNGPFGGLDAPPARLVKSTRESFGFNVAYQGDPNGLVQTMSCHAPGK